MYEILCLNEIIDYVLTLNENIYIHNRGQSYCMSPEVTAEKTPPEAQTDTITVDDTDAYDNIGKITDLKKDIVEYLAHNPHATNREVSEEIGCSISYPSPVRDEFSSVILQRAKEVGSNIEDLQESVDRRQKKRAGTWSDLTTKQRDVLRRLAEEDDPENPSCSLRAIIEDLDFDTHPAYVSDVKTKYVEYALKLKKAKQMADESQDPEALIDDIELETSEEDTTSEDVSEPEDTEEPTEVDVETAPEPNNVDSTLESIYNEIRSQKKMAQSEMKYTNSELAAGRLVMAEQIEEKLNELTGVAAN